MGMASHPQCHFLRTQNWLPMALPCQALSTLLDPKTHLTGGIAGKPFITIFEFGFGLESGPD
jgi:hypothetical protein